MTSLLVTVNVVFGRTTIFWAAAKERPFSDQLWQPWTWWRIWIDVVGDADADAAETAATSTASTSVEVSLFMQRWSTVAAPLASVEPRARGGTIRRSARVVRSM